MTVYRGLLLVAFCWAAKSSPPPTDIWTGSDDSITVSVNVDTTSQTFGSIVDLKKIISPSISSPSLVEANCKTQPPLWEISVVTKAVKYAFNLSSSDENIVRRVRSKTDTALELQFGVPLETGDQVNVQLSLKISKPGKMVR